jgi:hypothetical protein
LDCANFEWSVNMLDTTCSFSLGSLQISDWIASRNSGTFLSASDLLLSINCVSYL